MFRICDLMGEYAIKKTNPKFGQWYEINECHHYRDSKAQCFDNNVVQFHGIFGHQIKNIF